MNVLPTQRVAALPVLRVEGLSKQFDMHHLRRTLFAFEDLSFQINQGEFLLLRGENGAGKSTLLRTLYRTYLPRAGHVHFHAGKGVIDLARAADIDVAILRRREIGFVTQFLNARPRVAAEEVVAEPLRASGKTDSEALAEARRWLAEFGVKKQLWAAYPSTFSGGEQQKVNLARALILPPRLLLLDEPTASLDHVARQALIDRLAELKRAGVATIGVFHHPEDVEHLIDREIFLKAIKIEDEVDHVVE